jgi:phosphoglycolate phosphatase-like HAD superfamily hydrolase
MSITKVKAILQTDDFQAGAFRNIRGIIFDFDGTLFDYSGLPFYMILACPWDALTVYRERVSLKIFAGCDFGSAERYYAAYFAELSIQCH